MFRWIFLAIAKISTPDFDLQPQDTISRSMTSAMALMQERTVGREGAKSRG